MTEEKTQVWRSVYDDNHEVLNAIKHLHCPEGFQCDMTFGNGGFWKHLPRPEFCFDITPLHEGVVAASSTALPLGAGTLDNCVFDPPFLTYIANGRDHASAEGKKAVMSKRFGGYWRYDELEQHYRATLKEAHRVLKPKGKFVFKCQDIIHNHAMHCTHVNVIQWAEGFRLADLFVLTAKSRMPMQAAEHGRQTQKHARVFHSYFLVLERDKTPHPKNALEDIL